jgi:hypothetical protein
MEKINQKSIRHNRTICLPIPQESYVELITDASQFRAVIDALIDQHLELFPIEILGGYRMKDIKKSKRLSITIRRISVGGMSFTIRPSFVLPYMQGFVEDVQSPLFLRKFDVPFWALSHVFGKYPMYWYRTELSLGRNSLVGTTIKNPDRLPEHLIADEKHTRLQGEKVYVATTVGGQCILGASISEEASESSLTEAYGIFKTEAQQVIEDYSPKSVNTDGWRATQATWKTLFPLTTLIQCFLHVFIKMRDRSRKKHKAVFEEAATKLWDAYNADTKRSFSQRIRRLHGWATKNAIPEILFKPIDKLKNNLTRFSIAYDIPQAHRTSNMLDRLMQRMDRHLYSTQYFHGNRTSAEQGMRAWALLYNFAPSNPYTVKIHHNLKSPAERLNGFRYHDCWLQNLLISASMGGYYTPPLNSG